MTAESNNQPIPLSALRAGRAIRPPLGIMAPEPEPAAPSHPIWVAGAFLEHK